MRQFLLFWGRTEGLSTVLYTRMGITPHSIEGISSCALMGYVDHILISLFTIIYIYSIVPSISDLSYKATFQNYFRNLWDLTPNGDCFRPTLCSIAMPPRLKPSFRKRDRYLIARDTDEMHKALKVTGLHGLSSRL